jgi:hypothetical protein
MSHTELLQPLERQPTVKPAELLDFARFLAQRSQADQGKPTSLAESSMAQWINNPLRVKTFLPLSRGDTNAR